MADPLALPDQIAHVLATHDDAEVDNPNWEQDGNYGFMYRRGTLLTRQTDATRVGRELTGYLRAYNNRNIDAWRRDGAGDAGQREPEPQIRVARNLPGSQLLEFSSGLDNTIRAEPSVPQCLD